MQYKISDERYIGRRPQELINKLWGKVETSSYLIRDVIKFIDIVVPLKETSLDPVHKTKEVHSYGKRETKLPMPL